MATITIKTRYIIIAIIIATLALFVTGYVIGHRRADRASQVQIGALAGQITRQSLTIDDQKVYIAEKEQEILTLKQAKEEGLVTNEALRKLHIKTLNELTKTNLTLKIVRDSVKHNGKIVTIHDTISKDVNCIELPFSFADSSAYVNLWGEFSTEGAMSYGLQVPISLDVYTGISKETKKPFADILVDNPYVVIDKISSVKLDVPKVKRYGIGFQIGYGASLSNPIKMTPTISLGLSYNFIRF
jgi:hypothetical protein